MFAAAIVRIAAEVLSRQVPIGFLPVFSLERSF